MTAANPRRRADAQASSLANRNSRPLRYLIFRGSIPQPNCARPCRNSGLIQRNIRGRGHAHADAPYPVGLLSACGERPRDHGTAEHTKKFAPPHVCIRLRRRQLIGSNEYFHRAETTFAAATRDARRCRIRVKSGNTHWEQLFSGLHPKADLRSAR